MYLKHTHTCLDVPLRKSRKTLFFSPQKNLKHTALIPVKKG